MKILEIVRFNNGYAYVLDNDAPLVYHEEYVYDEVFKSNKRMLVGESEGGCMDFLTYAPHCGNFRAFAGRELHVQMDDGSTQTLKDDWWSEGASRWAKAHDVNLHSFTHNTLDNLINCCVFCGGTIRADRLQELINEFNELHSDYTPWEYDDWHAHCYGLKLKTYLVCPACLNAVPSDTVPQRRCPKCGSQLLTYAEHTRSTLDRLEGSDRNA